LDEAAALLLGEHDFRAFTPTNTEHEYTRRVVREALWVDREEASSSRITADSFLRHMVRILVGRCSSSAAALRGAPRRPLAGRCRTTAPPWGLCLKHVQY
jgi:tRNA pseudouridine38-40 synthase